MTKVVRRLLAGSPENRFMVECAVLADGVTSPSSDVLDSLKAGILTPDPDRKEGDPWPDEEQPVDYYKFMAMLRHLLKHGEPEHQREVNDLEAGVWEFKISTKRLTFFDTDGAGSFEPKLRILAIEKAPYPDSDFWWFPEFEHILRVGHAFVKTGPQAGADNIRMSQEVRREDLAHDNQTEIQA